MRLPGNGGCDFVADPNESAHDAKVLWRPDVDPGTVVWSALPPGCDLSPPAPWSGAVSLRTSDEDNTRPADDPYDQIWITGEHSTDTPFGALVPFDDMLPQRLAAIFVLWRHMREEKAPLPPEITPQKRQRLILGLRVLDGAAAGHSHRAIARGMFGPSRVPSGPAWKSHHLRSRIVRLLADARILRDGGYRDLLRSGRTVRF